MTNGHCTKTEMASKSTKKKEAQAAGKTAPSHRAVERTAKAADTASAEQKSSRS